MTWRDTLRRAGDRPVIRFLAVGGSLTLVNLALLWVLTALLGWHYLPACTLLFFVLNFVGYRLNKALSFQLGRRIVGRELVRYFTVMGASLGVNLGLMVLLVRGAGLGVLPASLAVSVVLAAANFVAHRSVTFARTQRPRREAADGPAATAGALHVLQVSAFYPAHGGGIEVVAGHLARQLARDQVRVTWMAGGPSAEHPAASDWPGVEIVPASAIDLVERRLGVPAPLWSAHSLKHLWQLVGACDVVHVHDYLYAPSLAALCFAACRGRPVVLTQHVGDIPFPSAFARGLLRTLNHVLGRVVLGRASQVVFVGRPVMAYFDRFVHWRQPPLLVPNGVDHARYHDTAEPTDDNDRDGRPPLRALFVGRFVDKKGLPLLRACMDVPEIAWTFVGRGPLSPAEWPAPARGSLRLAGLLPPEAVVREMRAADLLVLPSRGEGFPLVVQEALACGTPVLTSRDVFDTFPQTDTRCVFAVDIDGSDAVDRLREALRARTAALASLRAARAAAVELADQWSWERCADAYRVIYFRLRGAPDA